MGHFPEQLLYASSHEWLDIEEDIATIGITDHAQHQLGDVVFVELPQAGDEIERGDEVAVIESVKTAADIYSPVSGVVTEVNKSLQDQPGLVNSKPYREGWLYRVQVSDLNSVKELLNHQRYREHIEQPSSADAS